MPKNGEPSMKNFKKFNIVGTSGSGKSTLAAIIAQKINGKYVGLDELHWGPSWEARKDDVLFPSLEKSLQCDRWVLDGNYHRTAPIKWREVDCVVWIDLPFWLTFYQAITRAIKRSLSRKEIWPGTGNVETFSKTFFSRDSVLLWTITSYKNIKRRYEEIFSDPQYQHIHFVRLRSRREVNSFIDRL